VDGREAYGVGVWVSRLESTSPILSVSDLSDRNRVFLLL
jgi:hypothetical protein